MSECRPLENLHLLLNTHMQVCGWPDLKAVMVSVGTSKPWVSGFEPL